MEPQSLEILNNNILHVNLGNLDKEESIDRLMELRAEIANTVKDMFEKSGHKKVSSLVDVSSIDKYTPEAFSILVGLLKDTSPYVEKTATYGGNPYVLMAQEAVAAMSQRENIKGFATREEAEGWISEG